MAFLNSFAGVFALLLNARALLSHCCCCQTLSEHAPIFYTKQVGESLLIAQGLDHWSRADAKDNVAPSRECVQMKKIGLEIPESTRKDIDYIQETELWSCYKTHHILGTNLVSKNNRRRILQSCTSGNLWKESGNQCYPCNDIFVGCATCNKSDCLTCQPGRFNYLESGRLLCLTMCSTQLNGSTCEECSSNTTVSAMLSYGNSCLQICQQGQYSFQNTCYDCPEGCSECISRSIYSLGSACLACSPGYEHDGYSACQLKPVVCADNMIKSLLGIGCVVGEFLFREYFSSIPVGALQLYIDYSSVYTFYPYIYASSNGMWMTNRTFSCMNEYVFMAYYCVKLDPLYGNVTSASIPGAPTLNLALDYCYMYTDTMASIWHVALPHEGCWTCGLGRVLYPDGVCRRGCRANELDQGDAVFNTTCVPLTETNCIAVDPTTSQCTQCADYYFLNEQSCVPCPSYCRTCTSAIGCVECAPSYSLINSNCTAVCSTGTYWNGANCQAISANKCLTMDSASCSSCAAGYALIDSQCVHECPVGTYYNTTYSSCRLCHQKCTMCSGPLDSECRLTNSPRYFPTATLKCNDSSLCNWWSGKCEYCMIMPQTNYCRCLTPSDGYYFDTVSLPVKYVKQCSQGNYYNNVTDSCEPCHFACSDCFGPTNVNCSLCATGYFRYSNFCAPADAYMYSNCKVREGYRINQDTLQCEPCSVANCMNCDDEKDKCQYCNVDYYLSDGQCIQGLPNTRYFQGGYGDVLSCKAGYSSRYSCSSRYSREGEQSPGIVCKEECLDCISGDDACTKCYPGDKLITLQGTCEVNNRVDLGSYVYDGDVPVRCKRPCKACVNIPTQCTTCNRGYYLSGTDCLECSIICLTCSGAASNCTSCHMGYTYDGALGTCTAVCERYEYLDTATGECVVCHPRCRRCIAPLDNRKFLCTMCPGGSYIVNGDCLPCHDTCLSCTGPSPDQCSRCHPSLARDSAGRCAKVCPQNSYLTYFTYYGTCFRCHYGCASCIDGRPSSCTSCYSGYIFRSLLHTEPGLPPGTGYCQPNCSRGYFALTPYPNACLACHMYCSDCMGPSADECYSCKSGYFLRGSTCYPCFPGNSSCIGWTQFDLTPNCPFQHVFNRSVSQCVVSCPPVKFFLDAVIGCTPCHPDCHTCSSTSSTGCLLCSADRPFRNLNGTCRDACGAGSYYDPPTDNCKPCIGNCETCTGPTALECTKCFSGFFLFSDNTCVGQCPRGYFAKNQSCVMCHQTCETCWELDASQCLTCYAPKSLDALGYCSLACPKGMYYYSPSEQCLPCHPDCVECFSGSQLDCTTCTGGRLLNWDLSCINSCSPNTLQLGSRCLKCHQNCNSCLGPQVNQCITCKDGMVLLQSGGCGQLCDPGEFADSNMKCTSCHPSCLSCSGSSENDCIDCKEGLSIYRYSDGRCIDCLVRWAAEPQACWFATNPTLTKASMASKNIKASDSLRLTFSHESLFLSRLQINQLSGLLNLTVKHDCDVKYTLEYAIRNGELLLDIYFDKSCNSELTLKVNPPLGVILANAKSFKPELIFVPGESWLSLTPRKAPDADTLSFLEGANSGLNSGSPSTSSNFLIMIMILLSSSAGSTLLKVARVLKLLARLRLLNVYYGPYLELFLTSVGAVFPIGGNPHTREWFEASHTRRGKLDLYDVTVVSVEYIHWQYAIYFIAIAFRWLRLTIRQYAPRMQQLRWTDTLLNAIAEHARATSLTLFGIEVLFYSLRCLSHAQCQSQAFMCHTSKLLSALTVCIICADVWVLYIENNSCKFECLQKEHDLQKKLALDANLTKNLNASTGDMSFDIPMTGSQTDRKLDSSTEKPIISDKKLRDQFIINLTLKIEVEDEQSRYVRQMRKLSREQRLLNNPALEQFFGNGIKLHKLRTPEGRYYNTIALSKLLLFDPFVVTLQTLPFLQCFLLCTLQCAYLAYIVKCSFKAQIFTSWASVLSIVSAEVSVLVVLLIALVCSVSSEGNSFATSDIVQFSTMLILALAVLMGLIEFVSTIVFTIIDSVKEMKLKKLLKTSNKLKEEQGLVRHRVIGRDLPGAEPPVPPVDADMSSSVADIKANQVGQSAKPVLGKTRLAPGKRLSRPPLQPLARK